MLGPLLVAVAAIFSSPATPYYPVVEAPAEPRGTILLLHAGGWSGPNPGRTRAMRPLARRFSRWHWRAVVVEYGAGKRGYRDVLTAIRRHDGAGRLCLYGESAGGHLAALAAGRSRRGIDCLILNAAPLDLPSWGTTPQARYFRDRIARPIFGHDRRWNPRTYAARVKALTLIISTRDDRIVPPQQARAFHRSMRPRSVGRTLVLAPGRRRSGHGSASREELRRAARVQRLMLARVADRGTS